MFDFNRLVERFLFRSQREKKIGRYYPSEIGNCLRKVWYSYKFPVEIEPEKMKIFKMGNMIHDFVTDVLKSEKNPEIILLDREFPFKIEKSNFIVSGRIDNLILLKENNRKILIEAKSTKNIDFINEPQKHHEIQLQMYMHSFQVYNGILLYIEKNTLKSKSFEIAYDEQAAKEIMERFDLLHKHLTENSIPIPEAKRKKEMNWMCKFCEYRQRCDEETISE